MAHREQQVGDDEQQERLDIGGCAERQQFGVVQPGHQTPEPQPDQHPGEDEQRDQKRPEEPACQVVPLGNARREEQLVRPVLEIAQDGRPDQGGGDQGAEDGQEDDHARDDQGRVQLHLGVAAADLDDITGDEPEGQQQQQAEKDVGR